MNQVEIAQIVGVVSILALFSLKFFIVIHTPSFKKSGRIAMFWTVMYVFFLTALRLLNVFNLATQDQLRIISGWSTVIPLVAVIIHLFFFKKLNEDEEPYDETWGYRTQTKIGRIKNNGH